MVVLLALASEAHHVGSGNQKSLSMPLNYQVEKRGNMLESQLKLTGGREGS